MKTFYIIEYRAQKMANRLLASLSIHAAALEVGARMRDLSFLERTPFAWLIDRLTRQGGGIWALGAPKFLPPTKPLGERYTNLGSVYFFGWMFRNPIGMDRHRVELLRRFGPKPRIQKKLTTLLAPLQGKKLIGIHLKLEPFKGFEDGEFLVSRQRVQEIVDEYLRESGLQPHDTCLVEVSDIGEQKDDILGLHLLSRCSVVIGDNSTFSNLAAWFGNIPHIVTTNVPIDWPYYRGKTGYFENKYATFTHGSPL